MSTTCSNSVSKIPCLNCPRSQPVPGQHLHIRASPEAPRALTRSLRCSGHTRRWCWAGERGWGSKGQGLSRLQDLLPSSGRPLPPLLPQKERLCPHPLGCLQASASVLSVPQIGRASLRFGARTPAPRGQNAVPTSPCGQLLLVTQVSLVTARPSRALPDCANQISPSAATIPAPCCIYFCKALPPDASSCYAH